MNLGGFGYHQPRSRSQEGERLRHPQRVRSRSEQSQRVRRDHDACVDGNDIYSTILGPTADDTVIFSVQTFLKFLQDTSHSFLCRDDVKRDSQIQAFPVTETKYLQTPVEELALRHETSQTEYVLSKDGGSQTQEMPPPPLSSATSRVSSTDSNTQTSKGKRIREQHLSRATCGCCAAKKSRRLGRTPSTCLWVSKAQPDERGCKCKRPPAPSSSPTEGETTEDTELTSAKGDCVQVRYAITKITRYCSYTTFEVMKSTSKKPRTMPASIEGVFVLRDCAEE